ncbi:MAG TPA: hypothetical protein VMP41_05145 [Acidimicrobiales bacterium]|nr:hypothetical protein [Acidimicrobiales bacterium]
MAIRPRLIVALGAPIAAAGIVLGLGLTASSSTTAPRSHATHVMPPGSNSSATPATPTPMSTPTPTPMPTPTPSTLPPPPPTTTTVPPPVQPPPVQPPPPAVTQPPVSNGIAQANGGDMDGDNNGGADDHDGDM